MKVIFCFVLLVTSMGPLAADPAIQFDSSGLTLDGFGTGAVSWVGLVREPVGNHTRTRIEVGRANLSRGSAFIEEAGADIADAFWIAVHESSGSAVPARSANVAPFGTTIAIAALIGQANFKLESAMVELLYVRPSEGIWKFSGGDGSDVDQDMEPNGTIVVALSALEDFGQGSAAPTTVEENDRIIAIDPLRLRVMEYVVGE